MTYKARRTRDLQGEVQAGTGISVTESVKPDGTKVYTLDNTAPGSEYFTTERTEDGWAILNIDNNIVLASSSEFDFNEKGVTFFTEDGEPFAIIVGTKAQGNQELKIIDANGNETIVIGTGGISVKAPTNADKTVTLLPGVMQLTNEDGNTTVEISNSDIYIYNNDEGNDNLIIEHSDDCKVYIRNRYGTDGVLIETYDDQPATVKICDQDGNEILNSESLVDTVNSVASMAIYSNDFGGGGVRLTSLLNDSVAGWITEPNNVRSDDYYDVIASGLIVNGTEAGAIEIRYSGVYELTIQAVFETSDTGSGLERNIVIRRNNQTIQIPFLSTKIFHWNTDGYIDYIEKFTIGLMGGDMIVPYYEQSITSGDLTTIDGYIVNIKKVR